MPFGPVGIIDIGSNSIRFVAYGGAERVPSALFNEKVMAALGREVGSSGRLDDAAMARALRALARFRLLAREIGVRKLHTVATAAVRDAANGRDFLKQVAALGLKPRLLSGAEEAELSGLGVISAIPRAQGIVADLGGGSLELIGVGRGAAGAGITLPLGVLRMEPGVRAVDLAETIRLALGRTSLANAARDKTLYLVGGSFRALGQLDLAVTANPLPIVHEHRLDANRVGALRDLIRGRSPDDLRGVGGISAARAPTLGPAAALLDALFRVLQPRRAIVSAFGLREGILYRDLDGRTREEDPLLAGALEVAVRLGRFGDHGALLDRWIAPLFPDDGPSARRLRRAACLLADIAWNAHPDFRAERAVDMAIHGNWVGIDGRGRALLGRALCSAFAGDSAFDPQLLALMRDGEGERASQWGKAIRLAQRLSGGTESILRYSAVKLEAGSLILSLKPRFAALYADQVARRHKALASALGVEAQVAGS